MGKWYGKTVIRPSGRRRHPSVEGNGFPPSLLDIRGAPLRTTARPCTRKGYPPDLFEARDHEGLPIFFDADGRRLHRVHGPNALSDIELSMQKLILADDLPVDAEALRSRCTVPLLSPRLVDKILRLVPPREGQPLPQQSEGLVLVQLSLISFDAIASDRSLAALDLDVDFDWVDDGVGSLCGFAFRRTEHRLHFFKVCIFPND